MARKPQATESTTTQETTQVSTTNGDPNTNPETAVLTVDENTSFKWADLPFTSQFRLAKGGLSHMLGNEIASQIVNAIRKELGHNAKTNPVTKEQVSAFRDANPEKINSWDTEFTAEKVKAIREGTLADRAITTREPARSAADRLALVKMEAVVRTALDKLKATKAQVGVTYEYSAADVRAKVKEYAATPAWSRFKAEAEAELARTAAPDDEMDALFSDAA